MKDLRDFLSAYENDFPDDVITIEKPIKAVYECTAIAKKFEKMGKYPLIIFQNVINTKGSVSTFPCAVNILGDRYKLAQAIGSTFENVGIDWRKRAKEKIAPEVIKRPDAPVKENVLIGNDVDLLDLPILHVHEMDPGPYITAGMLTCRDPETRTPNTAIQRGFVVGSREIRCFLAYRSHSAFNLDAHEQRGEEMKVAYWVGHHPSVLMGAHTTMGYPESHYETAGAVAGQPLRLVPSETLGEDFLVPADAEFVIEGVMKPGVRRPEAPFGEYPRYYGPQRLSPVFEVTALTHRSNPIWHSFMVGINNNYGGTQEEGAIYEVVKKVVPQVQRVYVPVSGSGRFHAYIQIKKTHDGQPKEVIMSALTTSYMIKHVIVVDDDIDIYDDRWVLWAIATRSQWDTDLVVVPGCMGSPLDPSSGPRGLCAKGGIDATKPAPPKRYPMTLSIPDDVMERIRLEDFIPGDKKMF
ncbi:MAG: UbiD family decarboxylase [Deltaproteobacteria bacterium]|nr:UbiD family decarboxylase [Deltaproteobacteria bacterium]